MAISPNLYSWRYVFFLNLPIGAAAALMLTAFLPETERKRDGAFDYFGFASLSVGLVCMQVVLDRGERVGWFGSTEIQILTGIGIVGFYLFIMQSLTGRNPFIPPRIFLDRNFTLGLLLMGLLGVIMLVLLALLPPFLTELSGYPILTTGLIMAPRGLGTMIASIIAGRLMLRFEPRPLMVMGMLITASSTWLMSHFTANIPAEHVVVAATLQGVGMGFFFVPLATVTFATLDPALRGVGTGLFALSRNLGSSIGVAVTITFLTRNSQTAHAVLMEHVTPFNDALRHGLLPDAWDLGEQKGLAAIEAVLSKQAATMAYIDAFLMLTTLTLACVPLVLLMRRPPGR